MPYKKKVFCRMGHPVGEIEEGVFTAEGVYVKSTRQGFVVACPVCGDELREWRIHLARAVEDVVRKANRALRLELWQALGLTYEGEGEVPQEYYIGNFEEA